LTEDSLANAVASAGLAPKAKIDQLRIELKGRRLYQALIEENFATEEALRDLMSKTFQIPAIDLSNTNIDEAVAADFPARLAREVSVVPVSKEGENILVAVSDPTDIVSVDRVKRDVRSPVSIRLATATQIREQVDRHYGPKLIGVLPSGDKLEYLINKHDVEIGKAPHNHITLTDPTVSNTHAILTAREGGFTIVDLGSRNGTFVNGERLGSQAHTLRHGDKVQLGQTVLTFRNPGETAANVTAVLSGEAVEEVRRRAALPPSEREAARKQEQARSTAEVAGGAAALAGQSDAAADESEKKKKKKKKKGGSDERLRAAYISGLSRIVAQVLGVVLAVLLALYVNSMRSGSDKGVIETNTKGKAKLKIPTASGGSRFDGGPYDASGVVAVPGGNGVLFVDNNRSDEVLWMQIDESGREVGPVKSVQLGVSVDDPEGITSDGTYYYVIGSQSSEKAGERNALVRFAFDAGSKTAQNAETMINLRDFLITNLPELNTGKKASEGGLNIEGIAWDFKRGRWLLGLRSPIKDGNAMVAAVKLRNPSGPFSIDNLQLAEPNLIQLKLNDLGIRDISFDPESNSFMIISGAPEHQEKTEFTLWEWSGEPSGSESSLRKLQDLDPKLKPEGITHVDMNGRKFLFVVCDVSAYLKLDYAEGQ